MEQATDALKIAFAVLVFVIALSVSINAFSEAKRTTDVLIENADRETEYINLESAQEGSAYYNYSGGDTTRKVSVDSVIPAIYRAYKENYKIVFAGSYFQTNDNWLYKKIDNTDPSNPTKIPVFSIDLKTVSISEGNQEEFLNGIMFHKFKKDGKMIDLDSNTVDGNHEEISNGVNSNYPREYFKSTYQIEEMNWDKNKTLYSILKNVPGGVLEEHLGTYYEEDEIEIPGIETDTSAVPEVNKNKKRVITYIANY